jgi:hypothetical protein
VIITTPWRSRPSTPIDPAAVEDHPVRYGLSRLAGVMPSAWPEGVELDELRSVIVHALTNHTDLDALMTVLVHDRWGPVMFQIPADTPPEALSYCLRSARHLRQGLVGPGGMEAHSPSGVSPPPTQPPPVRPSAALAAAEELRDWLDLTYEDLAAITGIGRSTLFSWRHPQTGRSEVRPRRARLGRLNLLHAVIGELVDVLGVDRARAAIREGDPSRLDRLRDADEHNFRSVVQEVEALIEPAMAARSAEAFTAVQSYDRSRLDEDLAAFARSEGSPDPIDAGWMSVSGEAAQDRDPAE